MCVLVPFLQNSHPIYRNEHSFFHFYIVLHCFFFFVSLLFYILVRQQHQLSFTCSTMQDENSTRNGQVESGDLLHMRMLGAVNQGTRHRQMLKKATKTPVRIFAIKVFTCLSHVNKISIHVLAHSEYGLILITGRINCGSHCNVLPGKWSQPDQYRNIADYIYMHSIIQLIHNPYCD